MTTALPTQHQPTLPATPIPPVNYAKASQMPTGALTWYVILNVLTLGSLYFLKIVIMKAIIDARNA